MKQQRALDRLEQIISPDFDEICKNVIFEEENGVSAFGVYFLERNEFGVCVTKNHLYKGDFSSMRTALSWCVADKYNQFTLKEEIQRLDKLRWDLKTDLDTRLKITQRIKDPARAEVIETKLSTKRHKLQAISNRLDKCVSLAKYWQIRGFNNEIARTRRTSPDRTNRPSDRKSQRKSH